MVLFVKLVGLVNDTQIYDREQSECLKRSIFERNDTQIYDREKSACLKRSIFERNDTQIYDR